MLEVARRRFTVAEFDRLAEAGLLAEDDRVELVNGEIIQMNPIGVLHAGCVQSLTRLLSPLVALGIAEMGVQNPVHLGGEHEPYPDVALLRPRADRYRQARPTAADLLLLIEVADTTLAYDRDVKVPLYAQAGVPEVWLVDLAGRRVHVYRNPAAKGYQSRAELGPADLLAPPGFPSLTLALSDILG